VRPGLVFLLIREIQSGDYLVTFNRPGQATFLVVTHVMISANKVNAIAEPKDIECKTTEQVLREGLPVKVSLYRDKFHHGKIIPMHNVCAIGLYDRFTKQTYLADIKSVKKYRLEEAIEKITPEEIEMDSGDLKRLRILSRQDH